MTKPSPFAWVRKAIENSRQPPTARIAPTNAKPATKTTARVRQPALTFKPDAFVHLIQPFASPAAAEKPQRKPHPLALRIVAAGQRAAGENFDPSTWVHGPSQQRTKVSGRDILAVARKLGMTEDARP
jgi:hypothetical protein